MQLWSIWFEETAPSVLCFSGSSAVFDALMLLCIIMYPHSREMMSATTVPPYISASPTRYAMMNAPNPVMNQPAMTVITPVILYTALSRPHARSASEVPIATMNVT